MSRSRILIFVVIIVAIALLYWWAGIDHKAEEESPMSIGEMAPIEDEAPQSPHTGEVQSDALPVVETATVSVQDGEQQDLGTYTLEPGERVKLEGSDYSIELGEFYNHWSWDNGAKNVSRDLVNPTVKVKIFEGNDEVGYGWAFANVEFFRMTSHGGSGGGGAGDLAFTLRSWEGMTFPSHGNTGE